MNQLMSNSTYAIGNERFIIADCLESLGKRNLARKATNPDTRQELIDNFLNIITKEARATNRQDVLELLSFAGLIYG